VNANQDTEGSRFFYIVAKLAGYEFSGQFYDRNDNGLYYKTTIVPNLSTIVGNFTLARSVNYNPKVRCKMKRTFIIVNYDPKASILQATDRDEHS